MPATSSFVVLAPLCALVLGAVGLGGGAYENLVVDPVWPDNPSIIRAGEGIKRARFWMPAHSLYEIALIASLWMVWSESDARWWTIAAVAIHLAARAWSFAYFIPRALRFEKLGELTEEQRRDALRWTQLSRIRPILAACSIVALCGAVLQLQ